MLCDRWDLGILGIVLGTVGIAFAAVGGALQQCQCPPEFRLELDACTASCLVLNATTLSRIPRIPID